MSTTAKLPPETLKAILKEIRISEEHYELATKRYEHLGGWLRDDPKSTSRMHDPHVFVQGSFRVGTAIKPLSGEDFDLDLSCELRRGIHQATHSQKDLKELIGLDLAAYRKAQNIATPLSEKRRCWRLLYRDQVGFHMDCVPAIPTDRVTRLLLRERLRGVDTDEQLAALVAEKEVSITDIESPGYPRTQPSWHLSNPEGFAIWFESRMRQLSRIDERFGRGPSASVDPAPPYKWESPLQDTVMLLKRHRDQMFQHNPDSKPISIIIATLSARAYQGEQGIEESLNRVLEKMESLVGEPNRDTPRIPNPVNPAEDFADRWDTQEGRELELEKNFREWIKAAKKTFRDIRTGTTSTLITEAAKTGFGVSIPQAEATRQARTNDLIHKAASGHVGATGVMGATGTKVQPHKFFGS